VEILHAVEDLIKIIRAHPLYDHLEMVSEEEVTKLKKHYNHFMYQARNVVSGNAGWLTSTSATNGRRLCFFSLCAQRLLHFVRRQ